MPTVPASVESSLPPRPPPGQPPRLLHGGLNDVQGEPYGRLFLALGTSDPGRVAAVVARLEPETTAIEVLGHVPRDV